MRKNKNLFDNKTQKRQSGENRRQNYGRNKNQTFHSPAMRIKFAFRTAEDAGKAGWPFLKQNQNNQNYWNYNLNNRKHCFWKFLIFSVQSFRWKIKNDVDKSYKQSGVNKGKRSSYGNICQKFVKKKKHQSVNQKSGKTKSQNYYRPHNEFKNRLDDNIEKSKNAGDHEKIIQTRNNLKSVNIMIS